VIPPAPRARPRWAPPAAVFYVLAALVFLTAVGMAVGVLDGLAKRDILSRPPVGKARISGSTIQYGRYGSSGRVYWTREGDASEHRCNLSVQRLATFRRGDVVDLRGYTFLGQARALPEPCAQYEANTASRQVAFLGAGVLLALGGGVYLVRWAARKNRLLREGAPATGRIRSAQRIGAGGKARYRVLFSFDAGGAEVQGKAGLSRRRARLMFGDEGPRDGDAVEVVYDARDPRRHELWGKGPG
jgi:hypothetical protein